MTAADMFATRSVRVSDLAPGDVLYLYEAIETVVSIGGDGSYRTVETVTGSGSTQRYMWREDDTVDALTGGAS